MKENEKTQLKQGIILEARGGWEALVVWIRTDKQGFYAVHCPGVIGSGSICRMGKMTFRSTNGESCPVWHWPDGTAGAALSVNDPPAYDGHPADLKMGEYEL